MKKILSLLAILSLCVTFNSCIKESDPDPFEPALELLNSATIYNSAAMEPANAAFRLATLMYEAESNEVSIAEINSNAKMLSIKTDLFADAVISQEGDIVTITYPDGYSSSLSKDSYKKGALIVNTGGKILTQLDAVWTITTNSGNPFMPIAYTGSDIYKAEWTSYTVSVASINLFSVSTFDFAISEPSNPDVKTSWSATYDVEMSNSSDMSLASMKDKVISVSGMASGSSGSGLTFTYNIIENMTYKPACGFANGQSHISSGKLNVVCPEIVDLNPIYYPSSTATIKWTEGTTDCTTTTTVEYNGQSKIY